MDVFISHWPFNLGGVVERREFSCVLRMLLCWNDSGLIELRLGIYKQGCFCMFLYIFI